MCTEKDEGPCLQAFTTDAEHVLERVLRDREQGRNGKIGNMIASHYYWTEMDELLYNRS